MKVEKVISLYRKAKKGNVDAERKLTNYYYEKQYHLVPSEIANIHGIVGHGSVFYFAEAEATKTNNKEYIDALNWAAGKLLEYNEN